MGPPVKKEREKENVGVQRRGGPSRNLDASLGTLVVIPMDAAEESTGARKRKKERKRERERKSA